MSECVCVLSAPQVSPASIQPCQSVQVEFSVVNTGKVAGDEVTQVYASFQVRSVASTPCASVSLAVRVRGTCISCILKGLGCCVISLSSSNLSWSLL